MKILAIDSSTKTVSCAILENENIIVELFLNAGLTHSQTLAEIINIAFKLSNIKPQEIDIFAVTHGPGSFTGIRIGMATIKAMAQVLNRPCIGISSLLALAHNSKNENAKICAILEPRNNQAYAAFFKAQNGKISRITDDRAINFEELEEDIKKYKTDKILCPEQNKFNKDILVIENCIHARNVGLIALESYKNGKFSSADKISPTYLRVSQAEQIINKNN